MYSSLIPEFQYVFKDFKYRQLSPEGNLNSICTISLEFRMRL